MIENRQKIEAIYKATTIKYKAYLVWGLRCNVFQYRLEITVEVPYTVNPHYILAYAYKEMLTRENILKSLSSIPDLDEVYLVTWEIVEDQ